MTDYIVRALDTRDRPIFEAGPYEDLLTAQHVADDLAGTWALPAFRDVGGRYISVKVPTIYRQHADLEGVVINRAQAYLVGGEYNPHYDTATLAGL